MALGSISTVVVTLDARSGRPFKTFQFYHALARPIAPTGAPLQILDLGCGTGLEKDPTAEWNAAVYATTR